MEIFLSFSLDEIVDSAATAAHVDDLMDSQKAVCPSGHPQSLG